MDRSTSICVCLLLLILHSPVPGNCIKSVAAAFARVKTFIEAIPCRFSSCCNDKWIPGDITGLQQDLEQKLHGQHLVKKAVVDHIKGHLRSSDPDKALVLSFHGPTGVGKNFVSRIIAENLYRNGMRSKHVHLIIATRDFPHEEMVPFYKDQLKSWIEGNVTKCERSLFIFDELDKLPALLLDVIKPYLDHYDNVGGTNYRKSIFIFLSNTGGADIGRFTFDHWKSGKKRESIELNEVEDLIMLSAINSDNHNGLWRSQLIGSYLITAYIPFLPLEKQHIRSCIRDSIKAKGYKTNKEQSNRIVDKVMNELKFYPNVEQVFSPHGCRRVAGKIDYVMFGIGTNQNRDEL